MAGNPEISVLLPVHNAEETIQDALQSILDQRFVQHEVLIIDIQSSDRTCEKASRFVDERFNIFNAESFSEALNLGVRKARGKYIAYMNPREMMHPERLSIQYATLQAETSITMCSTGYALMKDFTKVGEGALMEQGRIRYPLFSFLMNPVFMESSVMIRKSFLLDNGLEFNSFYPGCEFLSLWVDMAKRDAIFFVDPRCLVFHRSEDKKLIYMDNEVVWKRSFLSLRNDLLDDLLTTIDSKELKDLANVFQRCSSVGLLGKEDCLNLLYGILWKNKQLLYPKQFNY